MTIKMDPEKDLSQFHHCSKCEAGKSAVVEVHDKIFDLLPTRKLSPREAVMAVTSVLCNIAAAQVNPEAALEEAIATMRKLFERGKPIDPRRNGAKPGSMVH